MGKNIEIMPCAIREQRKVRHYNCSKLYNAVKRGARCGGIDGRVRRDNGRLQFTGKEILRYWRG